MTADVALDRLTTSSEPAIRYAALTELLGRPAKHPEVRAARAEIAAGRLVSVLATPTPRLHPYAKWQGAHWRLVSLMDLGVPATPGLVEQYDAVLAWLGPGHVAHVPIIEGLARRCGSQEGNALAVGVHLGLADDPRVRELARNLVRWQWPDGGWNCDKKPGAHHSSFNESCPPLLGLARFAEATGDAEARASADRAAEFFLEHRVVFSHTTGKLADPPTMALLHYPPFWHYDLLAGLRALAAAGRAADPRTSDALDLLESRRRRDGTWQPGGRWWRKPGSPGANVDVVDWGSGASEALTLSALRVLKAAGRWTTTPP